MELYNNYEEQHIEQQEYEGACFTLALPLDKLLETPSVRLQRKQEVIDEYSQKMKDGEKFPPIVAFYEEAVGKHWIGDGVYRKLASQQNGEKHYPTTVYRGTQRDALAYAVEANTKHGDRLTKEEKTRAVWLLVEAFQDESKGISEIARIAKVARSFVAKIKKEFEQQKTPALSRLGGGIEEISPVISDTTPVNIENQTTNSEVEIKPVLVERKGKSYWIKPNNQHTQKEKKLSREEWLAKTSERKQEKHDKIIETALRQQTPDTLGPFTVLLIDPPWQYYVKMSEAKAVENHYPTLSLEELCELDVPSICADDAILFLWVTAPMVDEATVLIRSWGFKYRTNITWHKTGAPGLGHWARINHEHLFICVRGSFPTPSHEKLDNSVWSLPRGRHSEKPKEFRQHIEELFPKHPKAELFARESAPGWTSIGNEIDGRDIRDLLRKKH